MPLETCGTGCGSPPEGTPSRARARGARHAGSAAAGRRHASHSGIEPSTGTCSTWLYGVPGALVWGARSPGMGCREPWYGVPGALVWGARSPVPIDRRPESSLALAPARQASTSVLQALLHLTEQHTSCRPRRPVPWQTNPAHAAMGVWCFGCICCPQAHAMHVIFGMHGSLLPTALRSALLLLSQAMASYP